MAQTVFVFKVALQYQKSIWRRIAVRGDQTLDNLHAAIFDAFDRYDEHLYSFYFPKPGAKGRSRYRDAKEYACPYMAEEHSMGGEPIFNAAKTPIASLGLTPKQVFLYRFDFGDDWQHQITVEQVDAPVEKGEYPRILDRRGESPPQYVYDDEDEDWDEDNDE